MFSSIKIMFAARESSVPTVTFIQQPITHLNWPWVGDSKDQSGTLIPSSTGLSVSVVTDPPGVPVSYQWYRLPKSKGEPNVTLDSPMLLPNETSNTLSLTGLTVAANDGDSYRVKVSPIGSKVSYSSSAATIYPNNSLLVKKTTFGVDNPFTAYSYYKETGLFACGLNSQNMLGDGTNISRPWMNRINFIPGPAGNLDQGVRKASAGARHGFVIDNNFRLWGWGGNSGTVGLGTWTGSVVSPTLVQIQLSSNVNGVWKDIAAGGDHSIGLCSINGQFNLYGWGLSSVDDGRAPVGNSPTLIDAGDWLSVAAGGDVGEGHSLAIKNISAQTSTSGTLWSWGRNSEGQLGLGDFQNRNSPTQVGGFTWQKVSAGRRHTLAIRSDGTLWAWGSNSNGQLGDGTKVNKNIPVLIDSGSWKEVSAGGYHSLAIKSDNTLWAWGIRTGDGTMNEILIPKKISNDSWYKIAAGGYNSVAIKSDKTLWTWGDNSAGALSNGLLTYNESGAFSDYKVLSPAQVDSGIWEDIAASCSGSHFLAAH